MLMNKEIKDRLADALISAFTFAAALSWRETLLAAVEYFLPGDANRLVADVIISLIITFIVIAVVYFVLIANNVVEEKFQTFRDDVDRDDDERKERNQRR